MYITSELQKRLYKDIFSRCRHDNGDLGAWDCPTCERIFEAVVLTISQYSEPHNFPE